MLDIGVSLDDSVVQALAANRINPFRHRERGAMVGCFAKSGGPFLKESDGTSQNDR